MPEIQLHFKETCCFDLQP